MASLCAAGASWALIVARGWLVYTISGSSFWVGIVTFAAMAPMFLAPPIAGFLADKFDRKRLLAILFSIQLTHNIVLALLALFGSIDVWHIVVLSFINGCARASQMPAAQALLPNLIPKENLLNAISLNTATLQGSRLVGPGAIVPLMATFGPEGAFVVCTMFYMISLYLTLRIKTVSIGKIDTQQSQTENFFAGLKFVYRHPLILPLMIVVFLHCCLTMSFESLLPVIAEKFFANGAVGTTSLMMGVGAGALCFVLGIAAIQDSAVRGKILFATGMLSGLSPVILGLSTTKYIAIMGCFFMGGSQAACMAIANAIVQMSAPDAMRGRVMSVYLWHVGGMMAIFNLLNAALSDTIGAGPVLIVAGFAFFFSVSISTISRPLRNLYFNGTV